MGQKNDVLPRFVIIVAIRNIWLNLYEDAVALWLVRWIPDRAVLVRALAGVIVLCSWARHFTLTVPLSTQDSRSCTTFPPLPQKLRGCPRKNG